jgi:hypothetical protein
MDAAISKEYSYKKHIKAKLKQRQTVINYNNYLYYLILLTPSSNKLIHDIYIK